jgi:hypothetical protein
MKELLNKTIIQYTLKNEGEVLEFIARDESGNEFIIEYTTDADCCSDTWFESIEGDLTAGLVTKVEEIPAIELEPTNHPKSQDSDLVYGYKIIMNKYDRFYQAEIIYRNSSNGFYSGSCELTKFEKIKE